MRNRLFIIICTFFFVESSMASCGNKKTNSQMIAVALYKYGAANKLKNESLYKLRSEIGNACSGNEGIIKKIYKMVSLEVLEQINKEGNLEKLNDEIVTVIDEVRAEIDGIKYKAFVADGGLVLLNNGETSLFQAGNSTSNLLSFSREAFSENGEDKAIFTGFIGRRDKALSRKGANPFIWTINKKHNIQDLNLDKEFAKGFAKKALFGSIMIRGKKTTESKVGVDLRLKTTLYKEQGYLQGIVDRCNDSFCIVGSGKVKYKFNGDLTISSDIKACSGSSNTDICLGFNQVGDELGVKGSAKYSNRGRELTASGSVSEGHKQLDVEYKARLDKARLSSHVNVGRYEMGVIGDGTEDFMDISKAGISLGREKSSISLDITNTEYEGKKAASVDLTYKLEFR